MKKILLMLSLLFFTTAGFSEVSDTLVTGGYDKQAMSDAIQHARKETDKFIEVMNKKRCRYFRGQSPDNRSRKNRAFLAYGCHLF